MGECRERIQLKLDKFQSVYSIAKEEGVRESAIRYQISLGYLKKTAIVPAEPEGTTLNQRNEQDQESALGIATIRTEERIAYYLGQGAGADHAN